MAQTEGIEAYEQPNFHWLADSSQYLYPVWDAVDIKCYTIVVSKKKRKNLGLANGPGQKTEKI